ncbi:MAG TPA: TetR/AcrR family transcriptional regulator [Candidatus Cybelea sp.]|nr:TetR/AcrR family transcriptional regulator [Candidatus Cybelea sp.]
MPTVVHSSSEADPAVRAARGDRRKAKSRQRLMAAARRLFVERGYHATRSQDIARAADVGHGTFYLHFADKRECFRAFTAEASAGMAAFVRERLHGNEGVEAQIRALLSAVLEFADRNPGLLKAAMTDVSFIDAGESEARPRGEMLIDRWAADWAAQIRHGAAAGAIRADYDPDIVGHAIIGLLRGGLQCGGERSRIVDNLTRFLTNALVPENKAEIARHHTFTLGRDGR